MTDDIWRRDADDEGRGSLFDDEPTSAVEPVEPALSLDDAATGQLPHWTEPATGEVPRLGRAGGEQPSGATARPADDELDVWSTFTSEAPVWRDDLEESPSATGEVARTTGQTAAITGSTAAVREPARITIGTDPSGMPRRPVQTGRRRPAPTPGRPSGPARTAPDAGGRNLPVAVAVGVLIAAVFIATVLWRPAAVVALIAVVIGLGAVEFYDKVAERGYRPAVVPGVIACAAAPVAAYWLGETAIVLVVTFAFLVTAFGFIGARGVEAGPLPNVSITMLGVVWIGVLGSFASLIVGLSALPGSPPWGTDTLVLVAIGVVANDVGAYFIGSAAGRTPLREWISPSKSVEGLIGGALFTIVALVVVGITERSDTWTSTGHLLLLAVVIAVMAPMGDLVESMFKRNLDVKDFGSIVKGHGGILDRFDGFVVVLPAAYYLTIVLEPWTA
ncbi:MAG: phosphatidate cytidylyltransferase [Ilumatobacteraceae bacterium]|jgi:phosphatidate cytidylyltransferase|nr:phosphatidate cytidylyltransferase [Ilumatobacteraceae bacterium]